MQMERPRISQQLSEKRGGTLSRERGGVDVKGKKGGDAGSRDGPRFKGKWGTQKGKKPPRSKEGVSATLKKEGQNRHRCEGVLRLREKESQRSKTRTKAYWGCATGKAEPVSHEEAVTGDLSTTRRGKEGTSQQEEGLVRRHSEGENLSL